MPSNFDLAEALEQHADTSIVKPPPNPLVRAVLNSDDFLNLQIPPKRSLLVPWLKEQSIALVTGWRGTGKTWFGMSTCNAVTSGEPFGPWKVETTCPCLYLEAEMAAPDIQERLRTLRPHGERKEPLHVYSDGYANTLGLKRASLVDPIWRENMKGLLIEKGIKLWVADNIASLTPGIDEKVKEQWDPVNQWLLELRFLGISTILIHHVGKNGDQRGTSAREDNIDVSLTLSHPTDYLPEDGARFVVKFTKARIPTEELSAIGDTELRLNFGLNDCMTWTSRNVRRQNRTEILKMIDQGIPQRDIAETLGVDKSYVSRVKSAAMKGGTLSSKGKLIKPGILE